MKLVEIARFPSRLEAETIGHALDQYDIPFIVQSPDIGVFGPGHVGTVPMGASLCVTEDRAEEVRELLRCVTPSEEVLGEVLAEGDLAPEDD